MVTRRLSILGSVACFAMSAFLGVGLSEPRSGVMQHGFLVALASLDRGECGLAEDHVRGRVLDRGGEGDPGAVNDAAGLEQHVLRGLNGQSAPPQTPRRTRLAAA